MIIFCKFELIFYVAYTKSLTEEVCMIVTLLLVSKMICPVPYMGSTNGIHKSHNKVVKMSYVRESFEEWTPAFFTLNPSMGSGAWLQSPLTSENYISPQAGADGEHAAEFDSWDYNSGVSGDLISVPVDLSSATSPILSFYFWNHTDQTGYGNSDYIVVSISNDGGGSWSILDTLSGDVDTWTYHSYSLNGFIGDTVIVKFTGYSDYGGSNMGIDMVVIGDVPDYDAAVSSIISPYSYNDVSAVSPACVVASLGNLTLYNFYVYAEAYHNGIIVYKDSVLIDSLPSGSKDTVSFSSFNPDSGYLYDFNFYTGYSGDGFPYNDTMGIVSAFYYSDRTVVGELITNTGCTPCKPANDTLDQIFPDYPDNLVLIRYHAWWPSSSDPFYTYNATENAARINYYGADYAPHFHIDGIVDGDADRDNWRSMIETEMQKKAPLKISVGGWFADSAGFSGMLEVHLKFTGEPMDTNLYLRVALVENGIRYNASNGQTVFYQVLRKMYPDTMGIALMYPGLGDTISQTVPFIIDSTDTANFDEDSLEFVVFVQGDNTKEILQGTKIAFSDLVGVKENRKAERTFDIDNVSFEKGAILVKYSVPLGGEVIFNIFDNSGRRIRQMRVGTDKGEHVIHIKDRRLKSGIYFMEAEYNGQKTIKKFVIMR